MYRTPEIRTFIKLMIKLYLSASGIEIQKTYLAWILEYILKSKL